MATATKRTLEERAARIRMKSEMLCHLPSPREDKYGDVLAHAQANRWRFDEDEYNSNSDYRDECAHEYAEYKASIQAFNDLLSDIYSMLE